VDHVDSRKAAQMSLVDATQGMGIRRQQSRNQRAQIRQENRGLYLCTYIRIGIQEQKRRAHKFMRSDEATSMKQMSQVYYGLLA
jgi:hypothetical protein